MTWEGVAIGRILGRAGDKVHQKKVLKAALSMFTHDTPPGKVVVRQI